MLNTERRCQILEAMVREAIVRENPKPMNNEEFNGHIKKLSKKIGIPEPELQELLHPIVEDLTREGLL